MADTWRITIFFGMLIMVTLFCFQPQYYKRVGWPLTITWWYFLFRGAMVFLNPWSEYPTIAVNLDQSAGQAFAQLLLIPLAVFGLDKFYFKWWTYLAAAFGIVNGIVLTYQGYAIMNANSFDSAMLAAMVPVVPFWIAVLFLGFIGLSARAGTALVVLFSQVFSAGARKMTLKELLCGAPVLAVTMLMLPNSHYFSGDTRLAAWGRFLPWWYENAPWPFGSGTGTFLWLGPLIDNWGKGFNGEVFLQMHCDWLQVMFEGGVIGLILVAVSYLDLLVRSWSRIRFFAALVGVGFFALTYHPLRFFPSEVFIACLIREIIEGEKGQ
jgi:hypothetical protein